MPKFRIQAPDGKTFDVEGPDGSTAEEALAQVQKSYQLQVAAPTSVGALTPGKVISGVGETAATLGSGMLGSVFGGMAGLAQGAKNLVSPGMPAADRVKQVQDALTYQPVTPLGQKLTGAVSAPFQAYGNLADKAGGAVTDLTGSPSLGAATNTGIQALPMAIGGLKPTVKAALGKSEATAATDNAIADPRNAAIDKYRTEGLAISPAEANPTLINRVLEGFSGQAKGQQLISAKNQPQLNNIVKRGLGISPDTPLSIETLQDVRKSAGNAYEDVRKAGRITPDEQYGKSLNEISSKFTGAEKDFPGMAKADVKDAVKSARVESFDASSGVDAIKIQRAEADKAFRSGDNELGKAHKAIADAIESQIERHMAQSGATDALTNFQKAREVIAKSYDVQKALTDNGNVDVRVLAKQLKKAPNRLTGDVKTAAEFGRDFPKSSQSGTGNAPTIGGVYDLGLGGLGGAVGAHFGGFTMGGPAGIAALVARPMTRAALSTDALQSVLVHPSPKGPGLGLRLSDTLTNNPLTGVGLGSIHPQSVQQHLQELQQQQQRNKDSIMIGGRG